MNLQEYISIYTSQSELSNLLESDKFGLVMIESFSPTSDGVTDDSTAVQNAIDYAIAQGSNVVALKGGTTYAVSGLTDTGSVTFIGQNSAFTGQSITVINLDELVSSDITGELGDLTTTEQGTLVGAINEVDGGIGDLTSLNTTEKNTIVGAINEVDTNNNTNATNIGTLGNLTTTEQGTIVGAINELDGEVGDLPTLNTTEKNTLVGAINEVYSSTATPTILSGIGRTNSKFDWAGAELTDCTETSGEIELDDPKTTGTVELTLSPSDIKLWRNMRLTLADLDSSNNFYYKLENRLTSVVTTEYSNNTFDDSGQITVGTGVRISSDGTKAYVLDVVTDDIFQYTLSTAYDISSASYASKSLSCTTETTAPHDFCFNDSGDKVYVVEKTASCTVFQYNLGTAWDISTASYASKSLSVNSEETLACAIFLGDSGSKLYAIGETNNTIYQYTIATPDDISTGTYATKSLDVSGQDNLVNGLILSNDGTKCLIVGQQNKTLYQYTLGTAWDISTGTYDSVSFDLSGEVTNSYGLGSSTDGSYIYVHDGTDIFQYNSGDFNLEDHTKITDTEIQANTELTSNGVNIVDLSSIDLTTYPNDLLITFQLDRDTSGDTSPTLSLFSATWEGIQTGSWVELDSDSFSGASSVVVDTDFSYDEYWIETTITPSANGILEVLVNTLTTNIYNFNYIAVDTSVSGGGANGQAKVQTGGSNSLVATFINSHNLIVQSPILDRSEIHIKGDRTYYKSGSTPNSGIYFANIAENNPVSSVTLKPSSGTITGQWKLYGRNL